MSVLNTIRQQQPLVLNLTNQVTIGDVANGLIALGASPIMSHSPQEAEEMVTIADAVMLNIGTLHEAQIDQMRQVWVHAQQSDKPVVFDPVGIGAVPYRLQVAQSLLNDFQATVIRGNAAEIAALAGDFGLAQGVDAQGETTDIIKQTRQVAQYYQTIVIATGRQDIISDGQDVWLVENGAEALAGFSGTGDMLSAMLAAGLGAGLTTGQQLAELVAVMGISGEITQARVGNRAPGSFRMGLFDTIAQLNDDTLQMHLKVGGVS